MFLKNYTSDVPAVQSILRIEQVLIACGVSGITKEYGPEGEIAALTFHIKIDTSLPAVTVRLPASQEAACQALWLDYVDGDPLAPDGQSCLTTRKRKSRNDFMKQAERTAWKLMQDWVEVQMSLIQMKQADVLQVFLPYVWDGSRSLYQKVKDSGYRALLPDKT